MSKILKVRNVNDYARYVGCKEQHPLVSVIDYAEVSPVRHSLNDYGVYGIFFHDEAEIDLAYGCGKYDYKKGTVICVAPGQVGGKEDNGEEVMLTGWALLFHPDLLHGFPLEPYQRGPAHDRRGARHPGLPDASDTRGTGQEAGRASAGHPRGLH